MGFDLASRWRSVSNLLSTVRIKIYGEWAKGDPAPKLVSSQQQTFLASFWQWVTDRKIHYHHEVISRHELALCPRANEEKEGKKRKFCGDQGRVQLPPVGKLEQGGKLSIIVDVERERDKRDKISAPDLM